MGKKKIGKWREERNLKRMKGIENTFLAESECINKPLMVEPLEVLPFIKHYSQENTNGWTHGEGDVGGDIDSWMHCLRFPLLHSCTRPTGDTLTWMHVT